MSADTLETTIQKVIAADYPPDRFKMLIDYMRRELDMEWKEIAETFKLHGTAKGFAHALMLDAVDRLDNMDKSGKVDCMTCWADLESSVDKDGRLQVKPCAECIERAADATVSHWMEHGRP